MYTPNTQILGDLATLPFNIVVDRDTTPGQIKFICRYDQRPIGVVILTITPAINIHVCFEDVRADDFPGIEEKLGATYIIITKAVELAGIELDAHKASKDETL